MRMIGPQDLLPVSSPPATLEHRLKDAGHITVRVAGIVMRMHFDDDAVREKLRVRYRRHLSAGEPSLIFNCGLHDGAYYFWSGSTVWCWPESPLSLEAIVLFVDATAMSALVRSDPDLISFHAAAVSMGDAVAAIVGDSTAGKTTTTVACARRGMQIYSDERVLIRDGLRVLPFLRAFNIRPGGAQLLHRDGVQDALGAQIASHLAAGWTDLSPFDVMPHLQVPQPRPLRAIFLLDGKGEQPALREVHATRSCPRLLESMDCMARARMDRVARALELLRAVRVFSLTLGRPGASAAAIESVLEEICRHAA